MASGDYSVCEEEKRDGEIYKVIQDHGDDGHYFICGGLSLYEAGRIADLLNRYGMNGQ